MTNPWNDLAGATERTRQSWRRTILSASVVGLLAGTKLALMQADARAVVVVALIALGWVAIVAIARHRIFALGTGRRELVNRSPALLALVVASYAVLAAALLR